MKINDGTGKGYELRINSANRAMTDSINRSAEHNANLNGRSFSINIEQTPTAAGDYFFYLKNTGTKTLVLEGMSYRVASAETVSVILNPVVGTLSGGSAAAPVNLNTGSSQTITGTIEKGNDITGISAGLQAYKIYMTSTETSGYNFDQDLFIPVGGSITFLATTGNVKIDIDLNLFISEEVTE